MNENQFVEIYNKEKLMYYVWGDFVTNYVINEVAKTENVDYFFKLKPIPRIKDVNSLVIKAFYRDKNYTDPYNQITDKVGTRFVVLVKEDVSKVKQIIKVNSSFWDYSEDKDFEEDRKKSPTTFEYQSVHFIVRNKVEINLNGVIIKENTPCEIQIRTLLQHAYSELTHDTIYKPKTSSVPDVHRKIARSMALIETTDEIFTEVKLLFNNDNLSILDILKAEYNLINTSEYEESLNIFIIDAYAEMLNEDFVEKLKTYINDNRTEINMIIKSKNDQFLIYRQPVVLLLFYLVKFYKYKAKKLWPLTIDKLKPIYTEMGIAFPE